VGLELLSGTHCDINSKQIILKCGIVQIFGNNSNKSKFDSGGNGEEIKLR
jgi:hypothetical protein